MELTKEQHAKAIVDKLARIQRLNRWSASKTLDIMKTCCEGIQIKPSRIFNLYFRQLQK